MWFYYFELLRCLDIEKVLHGRCALGLRKKLEGAMYWSENIEGARPSATAAQ